MAGLLGSIVATLISVISSASEATALWRYTNLFIIIIIVVSVQAYTNKTWQIYVLMEMEIKSPPELLLPGTFVSCVAVLLLGVLLPL